MKANELMNNDLCRYYGYICRFEIDNNGVKFHNLQNDNEYHVCTIVEPIKLNHEILEKNGFKYEDCNDEYSYDEIYFTYSCDFSIHINKDDYFEVRCIDMLNIKTQYVHELQHALRLCGMIELADSFIV